MRGWREVVPEIILKLNNVVKKSRLVSSFCLGSHSMWTPHPWTCDLMVTRWLLQCQASHSHTRAQAGKKGMLRKGLCIYHRGKSAEIRFLLCLLGQMVTWSLLAANSLGKKVSVATEVTWLAQINDGALTSLTKSGFCNKQEMDWGCWAGRSVNYYV